MRYTSQSSRKTQQPQKFICTATPSKDGNSQEMVCTPLNGAMAQASNYSTRNFRPQIHNTLQSPLSDFSGPNCSGCGKCDGRRRRDRKKKYKNACKAFGKKVYVKFGAGPNGTGAKNNPWGSLLEAQNSVEPWNTLIVLPSYGALNGGITLDYDQIIMGGDENTSADSNYSLPGAKPTLTNTTSANGGHIIVLTGGNHCVSDLHLKDSNVSAISFDNLYPDDVLNLTVKDVLITGHNKTNTLRNFFAEGIPFTFGVSSPEVPARGIDGIIAASGQTNLLRVTVKDNVTGSGYGEVVFGGAERDITIEDCVFTQLTNNTPDSAFGPGTFNQDVGTGSSGVVINNLGSIVDVDVRNNIFSNFKSGVISQINAYRNSGIQVISADGANTNISICKNLFENLEDIGKREFDLFGSQSIAIEAGSGAFNEFGEWDFTLTPRTVVTAHISCSSFKEQRWQLPLGPNIFEDFTAIAAVGVFNNICSDITIDVSNIIAENFLFGFEKAVSGNSVTTHNIEKSEFKRFIGNINNVFDFNPADPLEGLFAVFGPPAMIVTDTIKDNKHTSKSGEALVVFHAESAVPYPFQNFSSTYLRNCITSTGFDFFPGTRSLFRNNNGASGFFGPANAGNVFIDAYDNNFEGHFNSFIETITNYGGFPPDPLVDCGVNMNLAGNWWGPTGAVPPSIDFSTPSSSPPDFSVKTLEPALTAPVSGVCHDSFCSQNPRKQVDRYRISNAQGMKILNKYSTSNLGNAPSLINGPTIKDLTIEELKKLYGQ